MTADIIQFHTEQPDWPTTLRLLREGDRAAWEWDSVEELAKAAGEAADFIRQTRHNIVMTVSVGCRSISVHRWPDEDANS